MRGYAYAELGLYLMAQERFTEAASAYAESQAASGFLPYSRRGDLFAAQRDFATANHMFEQTLKPSGLIGDDFAAKMPLVTWTADRGRIAEAAQVAAGLQAQSAEASREVSRRFAMIALSLRGYAHDPAALGAWRDLLQVEVRHATAPHHHDRVEALFGTTLAAAQVARLGDPAAAQAAIARVEKAVTTAGYPMLLDQLGIARAEIAMAQNRPQDAVEHLRYRVNGTELVLLRATLARAYRAAGRGDLAATEWRWLAGHRGRAYAEWGHELMLQPITVIETNLALLGAAEVAAAGGRRDEARALAAEFARAWPAPPPEEAGRQKALQRLVGPTTKAG
jgi:hypothetical protein